MRNCCAYIFVLLCILFPEISRSQVAHGGMPESFDHASKFMSSTEVYANYDSINDFLLTRCTEGCRLHTGCEVEAGFSSKKLDGNWMETSNGYIYTVSFHLKDAKAIGIAFSYIDLPEGSKMYVYNSSKSTIRGAYTNHDISDDGSFSIEPVIGEYIILEIDGLKDQYIDFELSSFSYFFDFSFLSGFGSAGDCEVNVNCPEGRSLQNQADAVVRILLLSNGGLYWCTGTLVNNTSQDLTPYILTAYHCGDKAIDSEYERWIFYFLYESEGCDNPAEEPAHKTLVGCSKIAGNTYYNSSTNEVGSDFLLVRLKDENIPASYHPYYAGWNAVDEAAESADCIHHPAGDIKKISHTSKITSDCYQIEGYHIQTHWKVYWDETESGHGVTEGGSSGSPIFNSKKQIVGTLSGGTASCRRLTSPDFYGKFSFSWNRNGEDKNKRLDYWLDPGNTGVTEINGYTEIADINNINVSIDGTSFLTDKPTIIKDMTLYFNANFSMPPDSCIWHFEGATPENVSVNDIDSLIPVTYNSYGNFDVIISWFVDGEKNSKTFNNFVEVRPNLYPSIFNDKITILLNEKFDGNSLNAKLIKMNSHVAVAAEPSDISVNDNIIELYFPKVSDGIYVLFVEIDNMRYTYRVIKM